MIKQAKDKAVQTATTTKRVILNGEQLFQSVSLLWIVGFAYYAMTRIDMTNIVRDITWVALIVIGLRAAYEFIKFLERK